MLIKSGVHKTGHYWEIVEHRNLKYMFIYVGDHFKPIINTFITPSFVWGYSKQSIGEHFPYKGPFYYTYGPHMLVGKCIEEIELFIEKLIGNLRPDIELLREQNPHLQALFDYIKYLEERKL